MSLVKVVFTKKKKKKKIENFIYIRLMSFNTQW